MTTEVHKRPREEDEISDEGVESEISHVEQQISSLKRRKNQIGVMTQYPSSQITPEEDISLEDAAEDENGAARAGVISKLELVNFMCHDKFELDLGPQINFIIGRNGSGKSAVLTGISVALGAKATDTDRGKSLKGLIKDGKNTSRAKVTIANLGMQAYEPEVYGDKIIIERILRRDRPHSAHIMNSKGKKVSDKKSTIDKILEHFSITISNPMTILTQTEAKTFLAHSSASEKYMSFMKGTRLDESHQELVNAHNETNAIAQSLTKLDKIEMKCAEEFEKVRKVYDMFEDSHKLSGKREMLIGKFNWFFYLCDQYKYQKCLSMIKKSNEEILEIQKKITALESEITQHEKEQADISESKMQQNVERLNYLQGQATEYRHILDNNKADVHALAKQIEDTESNIRSLQKEQANNDKLLETEQRKLMNADEETVFKMQESIDSKKEKNTQLHKELLKVVDSINNQTEKYEELKKNLIEDFNQASSEKNRAYDQLQKAKSQEQDNNPMLFFNSHNRKLIHDIKSLKSQGKLNKAVRGPIGMNIKLKQKYQNAKSVIETLIMRPATTVLCEDYSDMKLLMNSVKRCGSRAQVIKKKPEAFDYSHEIPKSKYPTILDLLEIDDPIVRCQLVDSMNLHRVLFIPDREQAEQELLKDTNTIASVISIVNRSGPIQIFKKNGSLQIDPINLAMGDKEFTLSVSGGSVVDSYQSAYNEAAERADLVKKKMEDALQPYVHDLKTLNTEKQAIKDQYNELNIIILKLQARLEKISQGDAQLEFYQDKKKKISSDIAKAKASLLPLRQSYDVKKSETDEHMDNFKKIGQELTDIKNVQDEFNNQLKTILNTINYKKQDVKTLNSDISTTEANVKKIEQLGPEYQSKAEKFKEKASKYCELEDTGLQDKLEADFIDSKRAKTIENDIREQLERIESQIKSIQAASNTTAEEAKNKYLNAKEKLDRVVESKTELNSLFKSVKARLSERQEHLESMTKNTFEDVEHDFIKALATRGFRGSIDFDTTKGKLSLMVATKEDSPLRVVESFSGGEKSYAQIAFLFAIWGPMHSRIRGLDEFDVFMDQINRKIALKLILNKVKENPGRQTIFITPLSVSGVEGLDDPSVHIHEIAPPDRATA